MRTGDETDLMPLLCQVRSPTGRSNAPPRSVAEPHGPASISSLARWCVSGLKTCAQPTHSGSTTTSRALRRLEIISPEESSEARNQPGRVFRGLKSARKGSEASNHAEGVATYLVGSAVVAGELAFHVVSAVLHPLVVLELLPPQHLNHSSRSITPVSINPSTIMIIISWIQRMSARGAHGMGRGGMGQYGWG